MAEDFQMINLLTLIVPAFNEVSNLENLVPQWINYCNDHNYKLIIVNDGSTDATKVLLRKFQHAQNLKIIHHKVNRGYGAALKTGIRNADTGLVITIDADGQHNLSDIEGLLKSLLDADADMVIGSREQLRIDSLLRKTGKWIIRNFTRLLMPIHVYDLNSGMKLFKTESAQRYIGVCPDSMAFSDTIALIFISQGQLVIEHPITVGKRLAGKSTINIHTAFDTIWKILNMAMLFKPIKIFLPISLFFIIAGAIWGLPIALSGKGVSVGASLSILSGIIFLFFGLLAEQLSLIIKSRL